MVYVAHTCARVGCSKRPTYGIKATRKREFCVIHAKPGMINVDVARCSREGCNSRATFSFPEMSDAGTPLSSPPSSPSFRLGTTANTTDAVRLKRTWRGRNKREEFCVAHALHGMVLSRGRGCIYPGCSKRASYGNSSTRRREYCATHAETGMVNINSIKVPETLKRGARSTTSGARTAAEVAAIGERSAVANKRRFAAGIIGETSDVVAGNDYGNGGGDVAPSASARQMRPIDSFTPGVGTAVREDQQHVRAGGGGGGGGESERLSGPAWSSSEEARGSAWGATGGGGGGVSVGRFAYSSGDASTSSGRGVEEASRDGRTSAESSPPSRSSSISDVSCGSTRGSTRGGGGGGGGGSYLGNGRAGGSSSSSPRSSISSDLSYSSSSGYGGSVGGSRSPSAETMTTREQARGGPGEELAVTAGAAAAFDPAKWRQAMSPPPSSAGPPSCSLPPSSSSSRPPVRPVPATNHGHHGEQASSKKEQKEDGSFSFSTTTTRTTTSVSRAAEGKEVGQMMTEHGGHEKAPKEQSRTLFSSTKMQTSSRAEGKERGWTQRVGTTARTVGTEEQGSGVGVGGSNQNNTVKRWMLPWKAKAAPLLQTQNGWMEWEWSAIQVHTRRL